MRACARHAQPHPRRGYPGRRHRLPRAHSRPHPGGQNLHPADEPLSQRQPHPGNRAGGENGGRCRHQMVSQRRDHQLRARRRRPEKTRPHPGSDATGGTAAPHPRRSHDRRRGHLRPRSHLHRHHSGTVTPPLPAPAHRPRTHHHRARRRLHPGTKRQPRRHHHRAPPPLQPQRPARRRPQTALLLPAHPQNRKRPQSATCRRCQRRFALLHGHGQRTAPAPRQRKRLRLRRLLHRPRHPALLRRRL